MTEQSESPVVRRPPSWLIPGVIGLGTVLLVVVALVREPAQFDPDTPEGTVQEYLQAIGEERWEDAFAVLDPDYYQGCGPADLAKSAPREPFTAVLAGDEDGSFDRSAEIPPPPGGTVEPVTPDAVVEVILRFGEPGPFESSYTEYIFFELVQEDGFWWITGDVWPRFAWRCAEGLSG